MRLIHKGAEPPLLLAFRKTPGARYDGLPADAKGELRAALVLRMTDALARRGGGAFPEGALRRALAQCSTPDATGNLPPFAGAVAYWLRRRLGERPG